MIKEEFTNEELKKEILELTAYWTKFRKELRQILHTTAIEMAMFCLKSIHVFVLLVEPSHWIRSY